jgi:C4-dicarboxylate-specific signal transduction histidine kinase
MADAPVTRPPLRSLLGLPSQQRLASVAVLLVWSVVCLCAAIVWLQHRLQQHHEQALSSAGIRLGGVKDTLSITLHQLAALPLDLSHRPAIPAFLADPAASLDSPAGREVQQMLDRISADFNLPSISLIRRDGQLVASSTSTQPNGVNIGRTDIKLTTRDYFVEAMARGASMQFRIGQVSGTPGILFASRVQRDGMPVGVALAKQDTETLNRLLSDADGAILFLTDANGVVVLSNRRELLLHRVPGAPDRSEAELQAVYQRVPETLAWPREHINNRARPILATRIGAMRHVTLNSALIDSPFHVWVLEPLDEEASIIEETWTTAALLWLIGGLLLWLSWRRLQLHDAALRARREVFELTQALPLTVFRYEQSATGNARFAFLGRGTEALFGVDAATLERDPKLPWRLAGSGALPPTQPQEFRIDRDDGTRWVLVDSCV